MGSGAQLGKTWQKGWGGGEGGQLCDQLSNSGALNEKSLAKHLKYHFLLSKFVSELFKGIFV